MCLKARESHAHNTNTLEALVERELNSRMWGVRDVKLNSNDHLLLHRWDLQCPEQVNRQEKKLSLIKVVSVSVSPTLTQYSLSHKWSVSVLLFLFLCLSPKFCKTSISAGWADHLLGLPRVIDRRYAFTSAKKTKYDQ